MDLTDDTSVQSANQDVKLKSWLLYVWNLNFWLHDSCVERQKVKNTVQKSHVLRIEVGDLREKSYHDLRFKLRWSAGQWGLVKFGKQKPIVVKI